MKITVQDVKHVAELARLEFGGEELSKFTDQLGTIIDYIQKLGELDTENVPPTYHVLDIATPSRPDEVKPVLGQEEALSNAPARKDDFFTVPKFIED